MTAWMAHPDALDRVRLRCLLMCRWRILWSRLGHLGDASPAVLFFSTQHERAEVK